jgi:hypothetical protein
MVPHIQAVDAPNPSIDCRTSLQLTAADANSIRFSKVSMAHVIFRFIGADPLKVGFVN